jgi:hypothetical protein
MNFDDIITLFLFLVFTVSLFLKKRKTKKAQKPSKSKQSGFSVLGKLSQTLQEAVREIKAQAEQARKKEGSGQGNRLGALKNRPLDLAGEKSVNQTFWDEIDDRDDADAPALEQIEPVNKKTPFVSTKQDPRRRALRMPEAKEATHLTLNAFGHDAMPESPPRPGPGQLPRARGLQKAVIWSEILGKPVALKN